MTDNEIIKALERMTEEDPEGFSSEILDLINRQKQAIADERAKGDICAEVIKRQDKELDGLKRDTIPKLEDALKRANKYGVTTDKENEQLRTEIEKLTVNMNAFALAALREKEKSDNATAAAITEYAKRLKQELSFGKYIQPNQIDNLVKEMTGGE